MSYQNLGDNGAKVAAERNPHFLPWITVGLIAVVALVASIVIVSLSRANLTDADTEQNESQQVDDEQNGSNNSNPDNDESQPPNDEDEPVDSDGPAAIDVEPGSGIELEIAQWDVTVTVHRDLGAEVEYFSNGDNLYLTTPLIESLPDSCKTQRENMGFKKVGEAKLEALVPAEGCAAASDTFDEIWALLKGSAKTAKAL